MTTFEHDPAAEALDPAAALATIKTQRQAVTVRSDLILIVWGLAWMVGYTGLALKGPRLIMAGSLAAALVVTIGVVGVGARGLRGTTSRIGTIYGLTWMITMGLSSILISRLSAVLSDVGTQQATELMALLSSGIPCLVVGTIYMAGAMVWEEVSMAWMGGWILVVTAAATIAGLPAAWWIMAGPGGGGLLAMGLVQLWQRKAVR